MPSLSTIVTIFLILIMFLSLLKGYTSGFKKNIYRLISRILFWIVFFIITGLIITPKIIDSPNLYATLSNFLGLPSTYSTISEYLVGLLASSLNVAEDSLNDPSVYNTLLAAIYSILKIIFLIVFALIWKLLSTIIYSIFFKKMCAIKMKNLDKLKRNQEKMASNGVEDKVLDKNIALGEKKKKHLKRNRLIGLGTGLLNGLMSVFLIMSLVNSLFLVLPDLASKDNVTASNENTSTSYNSIYDYIVDKYPQMQGVVDYIAEYQKSNLMGITALKINGKRADTLFIDAIISGKSENYTVAIREEMQSVVQIAVYAFSLTNGFDMNSVNFAALNASQQEDLKNILKVLSNDNLVKNLGSVAVGVALTLDSVKEYVPDDVDLSGIDSINWEEELTTIASMVSDVYSLQKDTTTDLSKLDINSLDADKVESVLTTFASLQTFQIIADVGSYYAVDNYLSVKNENGNIQNEEQLNKIKEELADVVWKDDVADLSTLYHKYETMAQAMNDSKDENGKINVVKGLGLTESEDFNEVVDTIMETTFMTSTFADIIDIVKEKYIPSEYASLISPNITASSQFNGELKTLFRLIKDVTENGTNDITNLDSFKFESLNNIRTETILSSELLTHAMINILISSSSGEGIAGNVLGEYISVPDSLQQDLVQDANGVYRYNEAWYDNGKNQGELHIMLDTLKNVGSKLKTIKYPMTTLPEILEAINPQQIVKSKVLHYTLSKYILNSSGDFITIPTSAIDNTLSETVNGENVDVIKSSEIEDLITILTNDEIIDSRTLLKYYLLDENNEKTTTEIKYEDITTDTKYMAEIAIDNPEVILSSFTSDSLVKNEDNLNTLFASSILRTTISSYINKYDEYISMPLGIGSTSVEDVYTKNDASEESTTTIKTLKVLSVNECKNLLKTLSKLDINFDSLETISEDPMSLVDKFSIEDNEGNKTYDADKVKSIFDSTSSEYSEIMQATFSKYIKDFAASSTSSFSLCLVDESLVTPNGYTVTTGEDIRTYQYISSDEINNLLKACYYISSSSNSIFDADNFDLYETFINNEKVSEAFDSQIICASISKYIQEDASTKDFIVIPKVDNISVTIKHENDIEIKVLTSTEFDNLITGLKSLQQNTGLTSDNLFNVENYKINAINDSMDALIESEVLHASISKKILDIDSSTGFKLIIPETAVSDDVLTKTEIKTLVNTIAMLEGDTTIDNISSSLSYDEALDKFDKDEDVSAYFDSIIIRASITDYLGTITDGFVVPYEDNNVNDKGVDYKSSNSINIVTKQEMVSLIDIYKSLKEEINKGKSESDKVKGQDVLKVNSLSMTSLYSIYKAHENDSYRSGIFQASLSKTLFDNNKGTLYIGIEGNYRNENGDLVVSGLYDTDKYYYVTYDEVESLLHSLSLIAGDSTYDNISSSFNSTNIFSLDIDTFFESDIMASTMAVKVYDMFKSSTSFTFLDENNALTKNEPHTYNRYNLTKEELTNFYKAVVAFQSGDNNINNISIDFDTVINKCQEDSTIIEKMCNSYLMNYNVIKYIKEQNSSTFSNMLILDDYTDGTHEHQYDYYWYNEQNSKGDLEHFLTSIVSLYSNEDYKTALTNPTSDSISITAFANSTFIGIMTDDKVLCDSLPNIIKKLSEKLKNSSLDTSLLFIPDRFADSATYNYYTNSLTSLDNWKTYWKGTLDNNQDGQLYLFFTAIDAGNNLTGGSDDTSLNALIASDITRPMAKAYLKQIATSYNAVAPSLGKASVTIPSDDDSNDKWYQLITDLKNNLS